MKIKNIFFLVLLLLSCNSSFAQSKKEVKKLKIKSSTVTITEMVDGKEKTFNETYQKFDNSGNEVEDVEYNKDGTFKKKETRKYNKSNDVIEDIVYDEKENIKKKTLTEYNN